MRNLIHHIRRNRYIFAGIALSLFITGLESLLLWLRGPQVDDMRSLLGQSVIWIAGQFTKPPSLTSAGSDRNDLIYHLFFYSYTLLSLGFSVLLWLVCRGVNLLLTDQRTKSRDTVLLLLQLLIACSVNSAFLYIVAAELACIYPLRKSLLWLLAQMLLHAGIAIWSASAIISANENMKIFLLYQGAELVLQIMVFAACHVSILERRGRLQLAKTNAELLATQSLLTETVRVSERMRIARDLHDIVGHHLTALNLHLNLALRQTEEARLESLNLSSELAGSLLAEVRDIVGKERREQDIDLRHALESLCAGIPQPEIQLSFTGALKLHTPASAHTLFCCIQEAISNTMRHSLATHMRINLTSIESGKTIQVLMHDNGQGCQQLKEGNGLQGMRERIAELGGSLLAMNHPEAGFMLKINIPNERTLA
ncbi:sensor histidine kinase [Undibacterium sp. Di27W]|uniref:sensor histidine kinase n=1 Tax=Undibacterium sp. Di27W TaxID=3413036 RepID=UPI003BF31114